MVGCRVLWPHPSADHQHNVGLADLTIGRLNTVNSHRADRQWMSLLDCALALVGCGDRDNHLLRQLSQFLVSAGHVDSVACDNDGILRGGQSVDNSLNGVGRGHHLHVAQVSCRGMGSHRSVGVELAEGRVGAKQQGGGAWGSRHGMLNRELSAQHRLIGSGREGCVLGHGPQYRQQVARAVLAGHFLVVSKLPEARV